jgi:hypothetical protein
MSAAKRARECRWYARVNSVAIQGYLRLLTLCSGLSSDWSGPEIGMDFGEVSFRLGLYRSVTVTSDTMSTRHTDSAMVARYLGHSRSITWRLRLILLRQKIVPHAHIGYMFMFLTCAEHLPLTEFSNTSDYFAIVASSFWFKITPLLLLGRSGDILDLEQDLQASDLRDRIYKLNGAIDLENSITSTARLCQDYQRFYSFLATSY